MSGPQAATSRRRVPRCARCCHRLLLTTPPTGIDDFEDLVFRAVYAGFDWKIP